MTWSLTSLSECLQKRVGSPLPADGRIRTVSGIDAGIVSEGKQYRAD